MHDIAWGVRDPYMARAVGYRRGAIGFGVGCTAHACHHVWMRVATLAAYCVAKCWLWTCWYDKMLAQHGCQAGALHACVCSVDAKLEHFGFALQARDAQARDLAVAAAPFATPLAQDVHMAAGEWAG